MEQKTKVCTGCSKRKLIDKFSYERKNKIRAKCRKCMYVVFLKWQEKNLEKMITYRRRMYQKIKVKVFERYGKICQCCKENNIEFLAIDHINGNGNEHRRSIKKKSGFHFYKWLEVNNFPEGYQVLCHNCNMAKRFGVCPHKRSYNI